VLANVLSAAVFGIAAFAQPAIGRDYLAGHTAQARLLVSTAVTGGWLNVTAITGWAGRQRGGGQGGRRPDRVAASGCGDRLCDPDRAVCIGTIPGNSAALCPQGNQ
jgi:hypothetical protein